MISGLVIVLGHGGLTNHVPRPGGTGMVQETGQAVFDRHLPFWEAHGWPIVVISPSDRPISTKHELVKVGDSEYCGRNSKLRTDALMSEMLVRKFDYALVFEYDAFGVKPHPKLRPGFWGNPGNELNSFPHLMVQYCRRGPDVPEPMFMSKKWTNPPWCFDKDTANRMAAACIRHPEIFEGGWYDRILAGLATAAEVPVLDWGTEGFNCVPMMDEPLDAALRRKTKPIWYHSVKFADHFNRIRSAFIGG